LSRTASGSRATVAASSAGRDDGPGDTLGVMEPSDGEPIALKRIAKRTLSDEVFEQLAAEIVHGKMEPGVSLPAERQLCEMLGVNRGAVREALKRLAQAGLVVIQQGGGTKVLDFRRTAGLDLLSRLMFHRDGTIELDVAGSIMEMRAALAPDIARLCARRADDAAVEELQGVVAEMARHADDVERLQTLSLEFWDVLVRGSGNLAYELAFNTLRVTYETIRGALVQVMADEVRDLAAHRAIAEAVAEHDEDAARAAAGALVQHGTERVLGLIEALRER
jgi:GntR family transcriptional regulator, transcriptional repressor for pyruvate dehydrogenase complex